MTQTIPSTRNGSRTAGAGAFAAAAVLLLVATLLELGTLPHPSDHGGLFWLFFVVFAVSILLFAYAVFPLALGSKGGNGIVGPSALGTIGLIAFGIFWLVSQVFYLISTYFSPNSALDTVSTVFIGLAFIGGIIAAIVIIRAGVEKGIARWSLLVAVIVSLVTGAISAAVGDLVLTTVMEIVSTLAQLLVGVSYLPSRPSA